MPVNQPRLNQIERETPEKPQNVTHTHPAGLISKRWLGGMLGLNLGALLLFVSHSFAQTPGTTPSATPTQEINQPTQTPAIPSAAQAPTTSVSPQAPEADSASSELKKLSLEQLMDLDVTSVDKQPEAYGEAPAAIQVITNDEIRESGASSIPEALRLADNLDVAQKNSHDWAISARGFNTDSANKLLVLIDGRSVYTPLFSGVFWDVQNYLLEDIDRIEVISGPGGTLWGANAVNGVINITSKSAKDTQGVYVEGGGGIEPRDFEGARYGGTLASDIYYRVYGQYFAFGDEVLTDGSNASDSWRMGQGGFRMDAEPSSEETFTLQGDLYGGDENVPTGGDSQTDGGNVLGRWSRAFSDDSNMSLQMYYDRTYLYLPVPEDLLAGIFEVAPAGTLTDNLDTYDLDFQHHFHLDGRNNFSWGLGYRFTHDVTHDAPALAFDPAVLDQNLYSGFAQDEIKLGEDLFFTAGSKLEHNDYTGFEFEPSARLKWDVATDQMIWTAVSRAVRTPSRVDRDERDPSPNFPALGDILDGGADFESETVIAYELGYRAQLSREAATSVSTFFNNYTDIRSTSITPSGPLGLLPLYFQNNLEGQTWGAELTVDYQLADGWRLHAGYDLLKEKIWVKPGEMDINNALNETADPQNQVFLRSSIALPGNMELDPAFRWVDSFIYNNNGTPATVPSYAELDVRLAWDPFKDLEVSVVGQSLLHEQHLEYVISNPSPQEEIQRSVYGKVAWQF
jgi:iron complex outermembrane receptor protein